jgi:hypothetical protein
MRIKRKKEFIDPDLLREITMAKKKRHNRRLNNTRRDYFSIAPARIQEVQTFRRLGFPLTLTLTF